MQITWTGLFRGYDICEPLKPTKRNFFCAWSEAFRCNLRPSGKFFDCVTSVLAVRSVKLPSFGASQINEKLVGNKIETHLPPATFIRVAFIEMRRCVQIWLACLDCSPSQIQWESSWSHSSWVIGKIVVLHLVVARGTPARQQTCRKEFHFFPQNFFKFFLEILIELKFWKKKMKTLTFCVRPSFVFNLRWLALFTCLARETTKQQQEEWDDQRFKSHHQARNCAQLIHFHRSSSSFWWAVPKRRRNLARNAADNNFL